MYAQVGKEGKHKAAQTHRAVNLCGVEASAQLWQKQPACDNSSWVDKEAVKVTDAMTDKTGFFIRTEPAPYEHTYTDIHTPTQRCLTASIINTHATTYTDIKHTGHYTNVIQTSTSLVYSHKHNL